MGVCDGGVDKEGCVGRKDLGGGEGSDGGGYKELGVWGVWKGGWGGSCLSLGKWLWI